jgi:coproporphyrinogen III oxidase-like Fe-S oxidoreductase
VHPYRCANVKNLRAWADEIGRGRLSRAFSERLTPEQVVDETIMLGLRTVEGVDEQEFCEMTGVDFAGDGRQRVIDDLAGQGRMHHVEGRYYLTPRGMLVADACVRALVRA